MHLLERYGDPLIYTDFILGCSIKSEVVDSTDIGSGFRMTIG